MVIGLPRSVLYYHYFPFWHRFFSELGLACLVSPATSREMLDSGLKLTVDEFCLPVKIHFGHLAYLEDKADWLFSPGFGKCGPRSHFCPKLMGLPDLAKHKFPRTVEFWHELDGGGRLRLSYWEKALAQIDPSWQRARVRQAWLRAEESQVAYYALWQAGFGPPEALEHLLAGKPLPAAAEAPVFRVAVLGHPYLVYDEAANHQLLRVLSRYGARIYVKETVPPGARADLWPGQEKRVYWPMGQELLSAALYYAAQVQVDGLIFLSACLCGPDAVIGELLERWLPRLPVRPSLLKLTLDEHTAATGLLTRLEAFVDLLAWRKRHAH